MVLARSCSLTAVSGMVAALLAIKPNRVRQRLREFYYDAEDKRGEQRCDLEVEAWFGSLLGWVLSLWQGSHLALALEATSLTDRLVVLSISVLYRGVGIPVAWAIVPAHAKDSWLAHWLRLLKRLGQSVPHQIRVIVLTDRGLYSGTLFRAICALAWHPLMGVTRAGKERPEGDGEFRPLLSLVPTSGTQWSGRGKAFKNTPQLCTLVAWWEVGQDEPWLLVTDLEPGQVHACWYRGELGSSKGSEPSNGAAGSGRPPA
jgi:hypothetical protein